GGLRRPAKEASCGSRFRSAWATRSGESSLSNQWRLTAMRRISGDKRLVPGTPGTRPGTRKRPPGAAFNNMYPVYPEKNKNLYMRAKIFCDRSNSKIKFIAYKMVQKLPGTPGTPGTGFGNALLERVFATSCLPPEAIFVP